MSFWAAFWTPRWFYVKLFLETIIKIILCDKEKNVQLCMKCALCLGSWMFTVLIRISLSCCNGKLKLIEWFTILFLSLYLFYPMRNQLASKSGRQCFVGVTLNIYCESFNNTVFLSCEYRFVRKKIFIIIIWISVPWKTLEFSWGAK